LAYAIVPGSDGNIWFVESAKNSVAKMTPSGAVTEYGVPTPNSQPTVIAPASDGNIWFGDYKASTIGKVTPTGTIAEYSLEMGSFPLVMAIVQGPGQPWFSAGRVIGIGISATLTSSVRLPGTNSATALTIGSDNNVWYLSSGDNAIGRITITNTTVAAFTVSQEAVGPPSILMGNLTLGSDGALWFAEGVDNQIGRIDTKGAIAEFTVPTANAMPSATCLGPDGNIWFIEGIGHGIIHEPNGNDVITGGLGQITPKGEIVEYGLPPATSGTALTTGPDGNLWVADGPQIIRFRVK